MVVLAIIAIIAIPIIIKLVESATEESKKRSIDLYGKAVQNAVMSYKYDTSKKLIGAYSTEDGRTLTELANVENKIKLNVEYEGNVVCKTIKFYEDQTFYLANCSVDGILVEDYSYGTTSFYVDTLGVEVEVPTGLTPVKYNGKKWEIVSSSKKWYDYKKQEWANAVILNDGVSKETGKELDVATDVKAMFVYIPKYEYKIEGNYGKGGTSLSSPGEIEVNFISKYQTTPSTSDYIVHPAFTFGEDELDGIWVGKFEVSHVDQTKSETSLGCAYPTCEQGDNLRILPNVVSLRNNSVSNFFYGIRAMSMKDNAFGIVDNTHMMKNSEWGAVAYLSQSKYGKYGNEEYEGKTKEIYQNKSSEYKTGNSNGTPSQQAANTQCEYDNTTKNCGVGSSTTGNITGIYDMSGGAAEYVMGVLSSRIGGFTTIPETKYYETYTTYGENDIGHAISETSDKTGGQNSWFQDNSSFVWSGDSWFNRGGSQSNGIGSGVFSFNCRGAATTDYSSRAILVQTN